MSSRTSTIMSIGANLRRQGKRKSRRGIACEPCAVLSFHPWGGLVCHRARIQCTVEANWQKRRAEHSGQSGHNHKTLALQVVFFGPGYWAAGCTNGSKQEGLTCKELHRLRRLPPEIVHAGRVAAAKQERAQERRPCTCRVPSRCCSQEAADWIPIWIQHGDSG